MTGNEYFYLNDEYIIYKGEDYVAHEDTTKPMPVKHDQLFKVVWSYQNTEKKCIYAKNVDGMVYQFGIKTMLQYFEIYDAKKLGLPDDWQMKLEDAQKPQLKDNELIVTTDYLETLLNITGDMTEELAGMGYSRVESIDLFKDWTKEFEKKYGGHDWEEGELDYMEALELFEQDKVFDIRAKNFKWDEQAIINLQYIQNANCCPEDEFIGNPQSDINRRLAMKFTMYERDNKIDYDNPEQTDWESTITEWLSKNKR